MWPESSSVNAVNLVKKICYSSRDIEFFQGITFLARPDRNISIFRRRASRVTGNTLIKPDYASVRQSMDSLHRDTHNVTKKVVAAPCSETA